MTIEITQGDTLVIAGLDDSGTLAGITVTSAVALGAFYQALLVTEIDMSLGQYEISATPAQTANWPTGLLQSDLKYVSNGVEVHSDTYEIKVKERVTK